MDDIVEKPDAQLTESIIGSAMDVHRAQLLTFLKLSEEHVGLLINFNAELLKHGLKRLVR